MDRYGTTDTGNQGTGCAISHVITKRRSFITLATGLTALLLGLAIYASARTAGSSQLVLLLESIGAHHYSAYVRALTPDWLPSFLHVFALTLITQALVRYGDKHALHVVTYWVVIDAALELGQSSMIVSAWNAVAGVTGGVPSPSWPIAGTFSLGDLVGVVLGGVAAYITIRIIHASHSRQTTFISKEG